MRKNNLGVIHPWDNFPGGGGQFSSRPFVRGANHPKGNFLGGQLSTGKLSGFNYLRGNRPRVNYLGVNYTGAVFWGATILGETN